jgi:hypothetical protein
MRLGQGDFAFWIRSWAGLDECRNIQSNTQPEHCGSSDLRSDTALVSIVIQRNADGFEVTQRSH